MSESELRFEIQRGNSSRFAREKYDYLVFRLAEIERQNADEEKRTHMTQEQLSNSKSSSWKQKFEEHPLVFAFTLIAVGFVAGVGVSEWSMNFRTQTPNANVLNISSQIEALTSEHNRRLGELHLKLQEHENEVVSVGNLNVVQEKHLEAAKRVMESIDEENDSYKLHLEQLVRIAE